MLLASSRCTRPPAGTPAGGLVGPEAPAAVRTDWWWDPSGPSGLPPESRASPPLLKGHPLRGTPSTMAVAVIASRDLLQLTGVRFLRIFQGWNSTSRQSSASTACCSSHLHQDVGNVSHVTKSLGGGHGQLAPDLSDIHTSPILKIVHGHRPGRGPREGHGPRLRPSGARAHKPIGQVRMH